MSRMIDQANTIHNLLEGAGIDHLLLGDMKVGGTGHPRFNDDLDFVVARSNQLSAKNCLIEHGLQVMEETAEVCKLDGRISVDLVFAADELFREFHYHARLLGKTDLKYVGLEGVVALKIQSYVDNPDCETKELQDIAHLLEGPGDINWDALKAFANLFKQWPRVESIKGIATKVAD